MDILDWQDLALHSVVMMLLQKMEVHAKVMVKLDNMYVIPVLFNLMLLIQLELD